MSMLLPTISPFDTFKEFRDLEKQFKAMRPLFTESENSLVSFLPSVNTREGDYAYHIEADLPGVKKKGIKVEVKDGRLWISGERKTKQEVKEDDYYRMESQYGKFERSFSLPDGVDAENITASCEDGVLEVVVPKKKRSGKKTQVKVT